MEFAIDQEVCDERGFVDEDVAERYADELMERFIASPEGAEAIAAGDRLMWVRAAIELGIREVSRNIYDMSRWELEDLLLAVFPYQLPCAPSQAPGIVRELHALWRFVDREFDVPSARSCLELLETPGVTDKVHRAIADPFSFGFSDVHGPVDPDVRDDATRPEASGVRKRLGDARKARRRKRKAQKHSRQRNR